MESSNPVLFPFSEADFRRVLDVQRIPSEEELQGASVRELREGVAWRRSGCGERRPIPGREGAALLGRVKGAGLLCA